MINKYFILLFFTNINDLLNFKGGRFKFFHRDMILAKIGLQMNPLLYFSRGNKSYFIIDSRFNNLKYPFIL